MKPNIVLRIFTFLVFALCSFALTGISGEKNKQYQLYYPIDEHSSLISPNSNYSSTPVILEREQYEGDYFIGPEISTQLSGFLDYQTNGECKHYIYRVDGTMMHAIYFTAADSTNPAASRRTVYATSTDDGNTWTYVIQVPDQAASSFPSLSAFTNGSAVIANQTGTTGGTVHYDAAPGAGSFASVPISNGTQFSLIAPGIARLSSGNILTVGNVFYSLVPSDTGGACVFNTTTHTFSNYKKFYSNATTQLGMRWTYAAGPAGKAILIIDAIGDTGGSFGLNRMFIFKSTDNAVTWDAGSVLFDAQIIGSDTLRAFFGLDAIYDAAGNYYVAFNTMSPGGLYSSAKLWVSKNSGPPDLVASHTGINGIPEAANTPLHSDAGICTIDHPTLSLSETGANIVVAFSVQYASDTLNGFNKCHIYISYAPLATMVFYPPFKITNSGPGSFDERYPSLNRVSPNLGGIAGTTMFLVYQKDSQPGSSAFSDGAPVSRSSLIFRKVSGIDNDPGIHVISTEIPEKYSLQQNYPNPFNPVTKIRFALRRTSRVTISVFNSLGQIVAIPVNDEFALAGTSEITFDGSNLASGVYFYSIVANEFSQTKKMVILK